MRRAFGIEGAGKSMALLSREGVLRNSCVLADSATGPIRVAHLDQLSGDSALVSLLDLHAHPYAIVECKRVGVEEGMKKGPQTIEKAKQGAYVARTVSSLQKLRRPDGGVDGVIVRHDDSLLRKPYARLLDDVISSNDADLLDGFILTVGVVSNHGNWFTTDDHNKELRVLAQSYDWLLFLTDQALSQFIDQLLLNPSAELRPARGAFLQSYSGTKGKNRFTKVQMGVEADASLQRYFLTHEDRLSEWFNVITPKAGKLSKLRAVLKKLRDKDWTEIKKP
jgi:hypothetical protein